MKNSKNGIKLELVLLKDKLGYRRLFDLEDGHVKGDLIAGALSKLSEQSAHANHIYTQCKSKEDYDKLAKQIEDIGYSVKVLEQLINWVKSTFNGDKEIDQQGGEIVFEVQYTGDKDKVIKEDIKSDC